MVCGVTHDPRVTIRYSLHCYLGSRQEKRANLGIACVARREMWPVGDCGGSHMPDCKEKGMTHR